MKNFWVLFRGSIALALATCMTCPPALALVTLNEGHDRINVSASMGITHDSNVFAQNGGKGDFMYSTGFTAEYTRRAGWIGVNANMAISGGHYGRLRGQDFSDPTFSVELTKQTGRTTGSITINAARESRADAAVNTRTSSWNYNYGANYHYHIGGTYDLSGGMGYAERKYSDAALYTNLQTFNTSVDLVKVITSDRDMLLGYRYRYSDTSRNTSTTDHNFSLGVHGKVIRGINGSIRFGYQFRAPHGAATPGSTGGQFHAWSASGSTSYSINKKLSLSGSISKDFSTTATNSTVDSLVMSLEGQYAFNSHLGFSATIGNGVSTFLDGTANNRKDTYLTGSVSSSYSFSERLHLGLSYLWFQNWSTLNFADFDRSSWSFSASTRW
jgi:hypothetical protein